MCVDGRWYDVENAEGLDDVSVIGQMFDRSSSTHNEGIQRGGVVACG